jgi:hypothetical protein
MLEAAAGSGAGSRGGTGVVVPAGVGRGRIGLLPAAVGAAAWGVAWPAAGVWAEGAAATCEGSSATVGLGTVGAAVAIPLASLTAACWPGAEPLARASGLGRTLRRLCSLAAAGQESSAGRFLLLLMAAAGTTEAALGSCDGWGSSGSEGIECSTFCLRGCASHLACLSRCCSWQHHISRSL